MAVVVSQLEELHLNEGIYRLYIGHEFETGSDYRELVVTVGCGIAGRYMLRVEIPGFETEEVLLPERGFAYREKFPYPIPGSVCVITITDTLDSSVLVRTYTVSPLKFKSVGDIVNLSTGWLNLCTLDYVFNVFCPDNQTDINYFTAYFNVTYLYPGLNVKSRLVRSFDDPDKPVVSWADIYSAPVSADSVFGWDATNYSTAALEISVCNGDEVYVSRSIPVPLYFLPPIEVKTLNTVGKNTINKQYFSTSRFELQNEV